MVYVPLHKNETIEIILIGPDKEELLSIIRGHFQRINGEIKPKAELVSCSSSGMCNHTPGRQFMFDYRVLLEMKGKGIPKSQCGICYKLISVKSLLSSFNKEGDDRIQGIKHQIKLGDLGSAIDHLIEIFEAQNSPIENDLLVLSNQYQSTKRKEIIGSLSTNESNLQYAKITSGLLELLDNSHSLMRSFFK